MSTNVDMEMMYEPHYTPDGWVLVQITGTDPHWRVFAGWRGGYLTGDAWRLNSGITEVKEDNLFYYFFGHTGSIYACHKKGYGHLGSYNYGVLKGYESEHLTPIWDEPENILNLITGEDND